LGKSIVEIVKGQAAIVQLEKQVLALHPPLRFALADHYIGGQEELAKGFLKFTRDGCDEVALVGVTVTHFEETVTAVHLARPPLHPGISHYARTNSLGGE